MTTPGSISRSHSGVPIRLIAVLLVIALGACSLVLLTLISAGVFSEKTEAYADFNPSTGVIEIPASMHEPCLADSTGAKLVYNGNHIRIVCLGSEE